MSDNDTDSADDERSLFAKILRRSADELEEQPSGDDPDTEQRADEDSEDDEPGEDDDGADPVDRALSEGVIEAGQASKLREVTERMDEAGVQTLVDAISENDLDVEDAVDMIEAYNGDEEMDMPDEDGGALGEARSDPDADDGEGLDEEAIAELESRLETVDALADLPDRIDELEQRLDDLPTEEEVEEQLEQRLEAVGEGLDEEFEALIQRADIVGTPNPTSGDVEDGTGLRESLGIEGGD